MSCIMYKIVGHCHYSRTLTFGIKYSIVSLIGFQPKLRKFFFAIFIVYAVLGDNRKPLFHIITLRTCLMIV